MWEDIGGECTSVPIFNEFGVRGEKDDFGHQEN
jgi:hypothetical protein